nr:uncharacterized protein LOC111513120 [Leptinotarsa decemlineata]
MNMESGKCKETYISTKNCFQILAVVIASISAVTSGICFAWSSPFVLKISKDKGNYDITEEQASKFTILPFIVVIVTCPIISKLGDVFGRKRMLLMTSFIDAAVWILKATARNVSKCGYRKHGLKCTNLCSNCHGSENCSNMEEKTYEEVDDSDEIVDEEPMQSENNIGDEEGDGLEDFDDQLEWEI